MTDPFGFLHTARSPVPPRPAEERLGDWREVYAGQVLLPLVSAQANRCMDCGVPFCHGACPLGNLIPEWNAYAARGDWRAASDRLHATNNFPEFTGRLCPAPCEDACVLALEGAPVTIKNVEQAIADHAWESGYVGAAPPGRHSGRSVAVIGSGPAGLAAAQQLTRVGHTVVVYERDDRIGGLLRYGIPAFKMEKSHLERRIAQMRQEGTVFRAGCDVGGRVDAAELRRRHDAVVVVGGGDTGSDCVGTALRQGALSVVQIDINPEPGSERAGHEPWPVYPKVYRISHAHEEARGRQGADPRLFAQATLRFEGDPGGRVRALRLSRVEPRDRSPVPGTEQVVPAELVLLALGFSGPERGGGLERQLGLVRDGRGTFARDGAFAAPGAEGVFVAGDAGRGQSLVVWAIAEGRAAAAAVDSYLTGRTELPAPVRADDRPLTA
ncbi:glutamate synthase subunit beta [Streptomyces sp. WAC05292]|uniref:glutamate synthase subunit beta n=1 Tax=Streptomyces sp. WAC05292 TaxID=2487418 RepID=UPI000F749896|nr:glutamate synthase subunit beta [Streptomyces sp. WAC05292]RSS89089.1 glutamate synthase subunit beta [Streptomyces sp. WAC05292]